MVLIFGTVTLPPINVGLAEYSELFMMIAAFIYTLAFIVFTLDAVRSSATIRRVEKELAAEAGAAHTRMNASATAGGSRGNTTKDDLSSARNDTTLDDMGSDDATMDDAELVDEDMGYVGTRRPFANV